MPVWPSRGGSGRRRVCRERESWWSYACFSELGGVHSVPGRALPQRVCRTVRAGKNQICSARFLRPDIAGRYSATLGGGRQSSAPQPLSLIHWGGERTDK